MQDDTYKTNSATASLGDVKVTISEPTATEQLVDLNLMGIGSRVNYDELSHVPVPERTETFHPIAHHHLVDELREQLRIFSMNIVQEAHLLDKENNRYFGLFQLGGNTYHGVSTIMGLRNSHDMSISAGVCLGDAPFVCSNLCFNNEYKFHAKHTSNVWNTIKHRFRETMCKVIDDKAESVKRIDRMRDTYVPTSRGDSFIWSAIDEGALTLKQGFEAHRQWHSPEHSEFRDRNVWSLQNGITNVLRGKIERNDEGSARTIRPVNRHVHMDRTTKIRALLDKEYNLVG